MQSMKYNNILDLLFLSRTKIQTLNFVKLYFDSRSVLCIIVSNGMSYLVVTLHIAVTIVEHMI